MKSLGVLEVGIVDLNGDEMILLDHGSNRKVRLRLNHYVVRSLVRRLWQWQRHEFEKTTHTAKALRGES